MSGPRLLFDQNLSPRLVSAVADVYPKSVHVRDLGLERADDETIWLHAAREGFTIVTKDDDFRQRSFLRGAPPKVIWVRLGNCRSADVEAILRARSEEIAAFSFDASSTLLILSRQAGAS